MEYKRGVKCYFTNAICVGVKYYRSFAFLHSDMTALKWLGRQKKAYYDVVNLSLEKGEQAELCLIKMKCRERKEAF